MSSDLRITGLATGMDTQETINKIMKYSRMPLDRLKQQQQILLWKQEAYRSLNTTLSQLRDLVFNLKLQSTYNIRTVTSSNSDVATATVGSAAANTTYKIEVTALATSATNQSKTAVSVRSAVNGNALTWPITIDDSNCRFNITVGGVSKEITIAHSPTGDTYDSSSLSQLVAKIQDALDAAFGTETDPPKKVYVKVASVSSNPGLIFCAGQNDNTAAADTIVVNQVGTDETLSRLGFSNNANSKELIGTVLTTPVIVDATHNNFQIKVGTAAAVNISLTEKAEGYTLAELVTEINSKLSAHPELAGINVTATDYGQLKFTSADSNTSIQLIAGSTADVLSKLGFTSGIVSEAKNTITTSSTLWNLKDKFLDATFFNGKEKTDTFGFTINGQPFSFRYNTTLDTIISAINANPAAGVTVFYDDFKDKLVMTATKVGNYNENGAEIEINDPNNFLGGLLNINQSNETPATDAKVVINGFATEKKSNTFTINDVTFTIKSVGTTTIALSSDTSAIADKIEEFVNKYNEVIASFNEKLTEARATSGDKYTYYQPLTDEQKESMTEDQIKKWEELAKKGLLHNDSILSGAVNEMRSSLSRVLDVPRTLTGMTLTGVISLSGSNRFSITVGNTTKEIQLDQLSYNPSQYSLLVADIQRKLDLTFGTNRVKVSLNNGAISFTSQNETITLNDGSQNNGLNLLGFQNGATVSASYNQLSQIGITTGQYWENGKLYLDKDVLQQALAKDPDGVIRLLTNYESATVYPEDKSYDVARKKAAEESSKGIFYKLHEIITTQIDKFINEAGAAGSSTLNTNTALGRQLYNLSERIDTYQERLAQEEDRLWNIFTQMETAINNMNTQLAWMQNMFGQTSR